MANPADEAKTWEGLSAAQLGVLQVSVLIVALCGIVYELIIAAVSSYLLGNSVHQFSITIGLFMFAMGMGSYLTKSISRDLVNWFVAIEIGISVLGGLSSTILFLVFPYRAFYEPVMYALIVAIGTMVGLEIPILMRVLSRSESIRRSIAHVLSLDYVGALIGSVSFPLLLLPYLGLFRSSFCIGLLNIVVASFNIVVFARVIRAPRLKGAVALLAAAVLTAGMLLGSWVTAFAEGRLFADQVVYRQQTPYQRILVTRQETNGNIRLYLDGHLQFAEQDEYRYHEALVHPVMSIPGRRERILILGGGDGLAVREILKYPEVRRVDLVDIDPAVTRLCASFDPIRRLNGDSLNDPRVAIHNKDAFIFVRETARKFDRTIIDLPDPHNEALSKLYSVEFYRNVRRCLDEDGCFVTQSSSPFVTREAFWSIAATVRAAGMRPHSYHILVPSFGVWGFTLAAATGTAPSRFDVDVETRFLNGAVMAGAGAFGKDMGPLDVPVNSVFEPILYHLYLKGVSR